jgi:hypothetical protein
LCFPEMKGRVGPERLGPRGFLAKMHHRGVDR